jgi:hypothetical protein
MEDRIFQLSLIVSISIHLFSFLGLFYTNLHGFRRVPKKVEVVYRTAIGSQQKMRSVVREPLSVGERKWAPDPKILTREDLSESPVVKDSVKGLVKPKVFSKDTSRLPLDGKRQISIPLLKSEKITNPKYLGYNERIRDKIKGRAYLYSDDPRFEKGKVYLTFVVSSDGILKQVKIIDDKTKANDYLRSVGLRSIQESSPFPAFPEDLKYPELTFSVEIFFNVGE